VALTRNRFRAPLWVLSFGMASSQNRAGDLAIALDE
jgi:hypothetical protein